MIKIEAGYIMKKTMSILMALLFAHYSYAQTAVAPTAPVAPTPPTYSSCSALTSSNQTQTCRQALDQQYQIQLSNYNNAYKQYQAQIQSQTSTSALDAARAAETVNSQGKDSYKKTQIVTSVLSIAAFVKVSTCAGPTAPACVSLWTKIGIGFAALSVLSGLQSGAHKDAQFSACTTANQLTTTPSNCGSAPTPYNPSTFPSFSEPGSSSTLTPTNIVDSNGNCTASQEICGQIASSLPPGTSLKDYQKGLSAFASGKAGFKVNPDGTITRDSDGKKLDLASFGTKVGLISQGYSPSEAQSLLSAINKNSSGLDNAAAKSASGTGQVADLGQFDDASGLGKSGAGGIGFGVNGEANGSGLDADKNRSIASASAEGLVRDFNGENIGVQGDDIFKMMKRRYLLKDKQDSFLSAPAAPRP